MHLHDNMPGKDFGYVDHGKSRSTVSGETIPYSQLHSEMELEASSCGTLWEYRLNSPEIPPTAYHKSLGDSAHQQGDMRWYNSEHYYTVHN